jgi:urease accessory protein
MRRLSQISLALLIFVLCLTPGAALAHTGIGSSSGFMHGFMHPLRGLDHQLAMLLVGIFAYQLGGRALWRVPLTFVTVMAFGGFLGVMGVQIPFVEVGIALSVIVLGAIVALNVKASVAVALGVVGLFAIVHGHSHGSEMPLDSSGFEYGFGFMMATALLHTVGIGIGFPIGILRKTLGKNVYRVVGGLASVAGAALLFASLGTISIKLPMDDTKGILRVNRRHSRAKA